MTPEQRGKLILCIAAARTCDCDPTVLTTRWTERMLELVRDGVLDELLDAVEGNARQDTEPHMFEGHCDAVGVITTSMDGKQVSQHYSSEWTRYSHGNPTKWRRQYGGHVLYADEADCTWWVGYGSDSGVCVAASFEAAKAQAEAWAQTAQDVERTAETKRCKEQAWAWENGLPDRDLVELLADERADARAKLAVHAQQLQVRIDELKQRMARIEELCSPSAESFWVAGSGRIYVRLADLQEALHGKTSSGSG